ncbi:helix-turn-helix transcriptional regulator [Kribbella qitaiheensis]|uniref:helix-turn-helix transcriptional regulator n=1 Tax=Kribbella qitaiheensis TaxID=1544730 RepID=UPI0036137D37
MRLAQRRKAAGHSQENLAALLGVDRSTVVRWEAADTAPQPWLRPKLAAALRISVHELDGLLDDISEPTERRDAISDARPSMPIRLSDGPRLDAVVEHLREQWHLLVKTDNLLGPRHALSGVLGQLETINELLATADIAGRPQVVRLAAQYAESASWLYEDSGGTAEARHWSGRALEWAIEANDPLMTSWVLFRRSQQAVPSGNAAQVLGLAGAARRAATDLLPPMRAALDQQEAQGFALDGDESAAHRKLDAAHTWAATDAAGDARTGHGSFCTASYIEVQRAGCWLTLGKPERAISLYEATLPGLPDVYRRDRGVALGRLASAYAVSGEPEPAAMKATEALSIGQEVGSERTLRLVRAVSKTLSGYRQLPAVSQFMRELAAEPR